MILGNYMGHSEMQHWALLCETEHLRASLTGRPSRIERDSQRRIQGRRADFHDLPHDFRSRQRLLPIIASVYSISVARPTGLYVARARCTCVRSTRRATVRASKRLRCCVGICLGD